MSDHRAVVVPVVPWKHAEADTLSVVFPFGSAGYKVVIKTDDWPADRRPQHVSGVPLGVYIPVDCIVPAGDPQFEFLGTTERQRRIKARKFRGVFSEGLLAAPPPAGFAVALGLLRRGLFLAAWAALRGWREGDDVTDVMGVKRYDPEAENPSPRTPGRRVVRWLRQTAVRLHLMRQSARTKADRDLFSPPGPRIPLYTDIENVKKYGYLLTPGEKVVVTEKIHGANMRATFRDGHLFIGSHRLWKYPPTIGVKDLWWRAAVNAKLEEKLAGFPDYVFFGEAFGFGVQDLTYGAKTDGDVWFRCFDIYDPAGHYLNATEARIVCDEIGIPMVPVVYEGPYDLEHLMALAEKPSALGGGRAILKLVASKYRLRKEA